MDRSYLPDRYVPLCDPVAVKEDAEAALGLFCSHADVDRRVFAAVIGLPADSEAEAGLPNAMTLRRGGSVVERGSLSAVESCCIVGLREAVVEGLLPALLPPESRR